MAIQLKLKEGTHQTTGTEIDLYKVGFGFYRVDSGSYQLSDYRIRGFFSHHYGLSTTQANTGYIITNQQQTQGVNVSAFAGYDDWMSDVRPPRIDIDKFASEIDIYVSSGVINGTNTSARDGEFSLMGSIGGGIQTGRYHDVQESYSYLSGSTSYITNPINWVLEYRDNTKTRSIQSISSLGNTVTVTTTADHNYISGNAIRIRGFGSETNRLFGAAGERYSGNFKITVTGSRTFTYITKHTTIAGSYLNTGTCEFWVSDVHEANISSIQGNGTGTITINTSDSQDLKTDDLLSISGTINYNGNAIKVISSTSNSIVCSMPSNTSSVNEVVGVVKYSSRPPSAAIPINYVTGYEPKQIDDHTLITKLIYPNKDTYIQSGDSNGHGGSETLYVIRNGAQQSKGIFNFPIDDVVLSDLLFAEICTYYSGGSDSGGQMSLYQMTTDSWSDLSPYAVLNPLIASPLDTIGVYTFGNTGSGENNTYTKFTVTTAKILNWLNRIQYPSVALAKTDADEGITNTFLSSETQDYKPYMVISSGVIDDDVKPTLTIIDSFMYLVCTHVQGNGSGKISISTNDAHLLNAGDLIHLYNTKHYEAINAVVLGGADSPSTYTFHINIADNTHTEVDTSGITQRTSTIKLSALGYDESEISSDIDDISIRKGSSLTEIPEYNVIKSSDGHSVTFDFNLNGLDNGYYDVSVKDKVGNKSLLPFQPPVIMDYYTDSNESYAVMRSGSTVHVSGFNVDYYNNGFTAILGDSNISGGIILGGRNLSVSTFDTSRNEFSFQFPNGLQAEYTVSSIDNVTNELTISNAHLKVGDIISFNSLGNLMQPPLTVGYLYFVKTVTLSGSNSIITLSDEVTLINTIDLTTASYTVNMVAYNIATPLYIIRDSFNSYNYDNRLFIRLDEYAPKIAIDPIACINDVIDVTISDIYSIDQLSVLFINGTQQGSPLDVNGDGRVLVYSVKITAAGTFSVNASDTNGNIAFAQSYVIPLITPFIEVVGHTIISPTHAIVNIKVTDGDISPIIATNNNSKGVFVEGSVANSSYGIIKNLTSITDGLTFDIEINGIGDGIMQIYAHNNNDDINTLIPPVITSVNPNCLRTGVNVDITGINLTPVGTTHSFINNKIFIYEGSATNTYIRAVILSGVVDGDISFVLSVTDGSTLLSNEIFKVSDNSPPRITLIGDAVIDVEQNTSYTDLGAVAEDNISGDVTASIITTGYVDVTTLGTYYITYTAYDDCGNNDTISRQVNVGTGCPVYISVTPDNGYIGDAVTINATVGLFNGTTLSNIVTFNGVIAQIISGTREYLNVIIPAGASTGYVQVETGKTNYGYENCSLSNVYQFTVKYPDTTFDPDTNKNVFNLLNKGSGSIFNRGPNSNAIYNRDMSYSRFTEVTDENSMIQNLYTILLTRIGERFFNPSFGSTIEEKLFTVIGDYAQFELGLMKEINDLIQKYEPRVILMIDQSFVVFDPDYNSAKIVLVVQVPTGNVTHVVLTFRNVNNSEANI